MSANMDMEMNVVVIAAGLVEIIGRGMGWPLTYGLTQKVKQGLEAEKQQLAAFDALMQGYASSVAPAPFPYKSPAMLPAAPVAASKCGKCGGARLSLLRDRCFDCRPFTDAERAKFRGIRPRAAGSIRKKRSSRRRCGINPASRVQATIKAKAAPVAEAVPVEPPKIEAKAAPVKKAKGGRLEGSRNSDTNRILAAWDRHIEAGKTDEEARELVTRVECKNLKRGVKSIRQSVNNAIKKYRNNGRHNLE